VGCPEDNIFVDTSRYLFKKDFKKWYGHVKGLEDEARELDDELVVEYWYTKLV
jgi:hypothetical protein